MTKTEILLVLIGGVFVLEMVSVILQVGSFKLRGGKRIFRMSPIHHHFELSGWSEWKVVTVFWIAGLVLAVAGLALYRFSAGYEFPEAAPSDAGRDTIVNRHRRAAAALSLSKEESPSARRFLA